MSLGLESRDLIEWASCGSQKHSTSLSPGPGAPEVSSCEQCAPSCCVQAMPTMSGLVGGAILWPGSKQ